MTGTDTIRKGLQKNSMLIALVILMLLFQALILATGRGSLFDPLNISNIISQNAYVVILATGMLLCILTGGNIDLSVGSVVAMVGALAGTLIVNMQVNVYLSIFLCLIVGILIGAWQGFWIAFIRIPAFIVTLTGMLLWRGVALLILNGLTISPFPEIYLKYFTSFVPAVDDKGAVMVITNIIGIVVCAVFIVVSVLTRLKKLKKNYAVESAGIFITRTVLISAIVMLLSWLLSMNKGFPVVLILLAVIVLSYSYYTQHTVPGRYLYAMGGNEKAARLSGINTDRVLFFAYTNMGFLSAVAALACVGRFNSASPTAGTNYEMDAIGACYIGGASAYGGTGTVGGAVIGAIFMGVLNNGMSIMGIDANWQRVVKGLVLLFAVVFDVMSKKRAKN